ncbi:MAG: hypothetical protein AB1489_37035 [Acidobacteriota bacterium]
MKISFYKLLGTSLILCSLLISLTTQARTQEHPTGEHPGKRPVREDNNSPTAFPRPPVRDVTPDEIRQGISLHIEEKLKKNKNFFPIKDEQTKQELKLEFVKVHDDKVSIIKAKSEYDTDTYFACTDFKEPATGTIYDLDFWMKMQISGKLKVTKARIHKVGGEARFTYEGDKIVDIPVKK